MITIEGNGIIQNIEADGVTYTANGMIQSQYRLYERIELTSEFVDTQVDLESTLDTQLDVTSIIITPASLPK